MAPIPQDRLVRKEVALGVIREYEPPQDHIGLRLFAPFQDVGSDEVIFGYQRGLTVGMAPARAEDAEAELAGKDESVGTGRASIIDWAIKDHYDPSDVTRYREGLIIGDLAGAASLSLSFTGSATEEYQRKIARDTLLRRRRLDNRLEWLIMSALDTNQIVYNDGRVIFTVKFDRPSNQQDMATVNGQLWSSTTSDPIEDMLSIKSTARTAHGIQKLTAVMSDRVWRSLRKTSKFVDALTGSNPLYKVAGWGDAAAAEFISSQVEIEFLIYDSVYRTRNLGSNTITNTRFTRDDVVMFVPSATDIAQYDDAIGFGKTLTSPHAEGNFTPGFYEWERDTVDPWSHDMGTGIKAFPVFPHMDKTWVMKVL